MAERGYNPGDALAYRGYMIHKYAGDGWFIDAEGAPGQRTTISHYSGSIEIAKRIIDELID
jgi:hypothetical protein